MPGVSVKRKARLAKVWKLVVEKETNCMNDASSRPATPPTRPSSSASSKKAVSTLIRLKPSARSVPISPTRLATEAYMVIMAPIIAPMEKMMDSVSPRMLMNVESALDWSL